MLTLQVHVTAGAQALRTRRQPLRNVVVGAKKGAGNGEALDERGFITKDNSGRQNIFPTSSKAYYNSPRSNAVASSGLGGLQGAGVIAAALGIVVLATIGVINKESSSDTLVQINNTYTGDSLSAVAERLAKAL